MLVKGKEKYKINRTEIQQTAVSRVLKGKGREKVEKWKEIWRGGKNLEKRNGEKHGGEEKGGRRGLVTGDCGKKR